MPLSPTPNMLLIRPVEDADADIWDNLINTLLLLIDSHTHITGQGAKVVSAGININGPLGFNSNVAHDLSAIEFDNLGAFGIGPREIFVLGGDLYYRNNAGTNIPITTGATLSQTTVGGIAGDYTAVLAELAFVDSTDTYTFKQQVGAAVRQWAKIQSGDLSLFEFKANPAAGVPATSVTLRSPATLALSYAVTMPAALPASQVMVQMGATGSLVVSNTLPTLVTVSAGMNFNSPSTALFASGSQAIFQAGSTLTAQGLVDFSLASSFRTPARLFQINPVSGALAGGTATFNGQAITFTSVGSLHLAVDLSNGDRVNSITIYFSRNSGTSLTFAFQEVNMTTGAVTTIVSKTVSAGVGLMGTQLEVSPTSGSLPYTMTDPRTYYLSLGVGNTDTIVGIHVLWDRP